MLNWLFGGKKTEPAPTVPDAAPRSVFSTDMPTIGEPGMALDRLQRTITVTPDSLKALTPAGAAMDSLEGVVETETVHSIKRAFRLGATGIPEAQVSWYGSFGFIGHQMCAMLAQHWLIEKACHMPGEDAIRNGYDVTAADATTEDLDRLREMDERYKVSKAMAEFVGLGRVFGIRIALFKVTPPAGMTEAQYYELPYNPDGVGRGAYKGISQVDPYWCVPELDMLGTFDPTALTFYEPLYWRIGSLKIHKSHLVIYRTGDVPDILKPTYGYGGVPVPQRISERVYGAERTANEAPLLALTKRLNVRHVDLAEAVANPEKFARTALWQQTQRDNYGTLFAGTDETVEQHDTNLADLDAVIMTQYQIVAAAARVPGTKLLGTTPKGFNSSGEYEEATYREELESIQTHDLTPLLRRHHELCVLSGWPRVDGKAAFKVKSTWTPLDSPTAAEWADINLKKAQRDAALQTAGAIDAYDIRERLSNDKDSDFSGVKIVAEEDLEPEVGTLQTTNEPENVALPQNTLAPSQVPQ